MPLSKRLLITGGAGFIGSTFVRQAMARQDFDSVTVFDALTYAGSLSNLKEYEADPRFRFVRGQVQDQASVRDLFAQGSFTHAVNFAAESHNDRSILHAGSFIETDVLGVYVLLEAVREFGVGRFVHVSTDEVYGSVLEGEFTENSPIMPNTPYSASKAGGDLQIRAHRKAFGTPSLITRGGNTYGPRQFPEKLISFFVTRLIDGKKVPLYGEGNQVREWIHAEDHASGIMTVLDKGEIGEVYNVGDINERENREVVRILLEAAGRDESLVKKIPDPRKGAHDQRYAMSAAKLRSLGWAPAMPFEESLRATVRWYQDNEWWWRPLTQSEDYQRFIAQFYGPSLGEDL